MKRYEWLFVTANIWIILWFWISTTEEYIEREPLYALIELGIIFIPYTIMIWKGIKQQ